MRAGRDIEAIQYGSTILAAAKSAPSDDELLQEAVTLLGCCSAVPQPGCTALESQNRAHLMHGRTNLRD